MAGLLPLTQETAIGARSVNVTLTAALGRTSDDNKPTCKSYHRHFVPRIITGPPLFSGKKWHPVPKKSICPFCGTTYQTFSSFFGSVYNVAGFVAQVAIVVIVLAVFIYMFSKR